MLFILFGFYYSHSIGRCGTDEIMKYVNVTEVESPARRLPLFKERDNIRLVFDYTQLEENYTDRYKCTKEKIGQYLSHSGYRVLCTEKGVITPERYTVIKETMENARKLLSSMLRVEPYYGDITLFSINEIAQMSGVVKDCDMHITVMPRIYPEEEVSMLAAAGSNRIDSRTKRPIQGFIILNIHESPTTIESEKSESQKHFFTYIHEIVHALGMTYQQIISTWHPQDSYIPYNKPICRLPIGGIEREILVTPYAHKFAVNHYGVEKFYSEDGKKVCPSGIELEDGGGAGTAKSHPEMRISFGDLMTGISVAREFPFERFTELTMALLWDSGFYEVDWQYGKPLLWGSPLMNQGKFIENFATGPPQKVFPESHIYHPSPDGSLELQAGYDYSYLANTSVYSPSTYPSSTYKAHKDFYNPLDEVWVGNNVMDYQMFPFPRVQCPKETAALPNVAGGSVCAKFQCYDGGKKIRFIINESIEFNCETKDQKFEFDYFNETSKENSHRVGKCDNPQNMCYILKMRDAKFSTDPFSVNPKYETTQSILEKLKRWDIWIVAVIAVLDAVLLMATYICVGKNTLNDEIESLIP